MQRKAKILFEIKVSAVENYLKALKSVERISHELLIGKSTVKEWIRMRHSKRVLGLCPQTKN